MKKLCPLDIGLLKGVIPSPTYISENRSQANNKAETPNSPRLTRRGNPFRSSPLKLMATAARQNPI